MKKQVITIATAVAFAFSAGALLAGDGPVSGPESLGKINSADGIILAQSSFDRMRDAKRRKKRKRRKGPGDYGRPERPIRVIEHYLTRSNRGRATRRRDNRVRPGERVYFYYKVGPIRKRRSYKGAARLAPVKSRLVVKKNGRTVYRGTWKQTEASRRGVRKGKKWVRYIESSRWNYRVPRRRANGRYTAIVYFQDVNHRRTLSIRYNFTVRKRGRSYNNRNDGRYDRNRDRNRYNRDRNRRYGRTRYYRKPAPRTRYYRKPARKTRYYRRSTPRTKYHNRGRYGRTRYHGTRYYR